MQVQKNPLASMLQPPTQSEETIEQELCEEPKNIIQSEENEEDDQESQEGQIEENTNENVKHIPGSIDDVN